MLQVFRFQPDKESKIGLKLENTSGYFLHYIRVFK